MTFDSSFTSLLDTNLACQTGERLALVTDDASFDQPSSDFPTRVALANAIAEIGRQRGLELAVVTYAQRSESGVEPPLEVFDAVYPAGFVEMLQQQQIADRLLGKTLTDDDLAVLQAWLADQPMRYDALLVLSGRSVSHTNFRRLLTGTKRCRAATMPGVEVEMFAGVMTADWKQVERRSIAAAKALSAASSATVISAGGRELRFSLAGRDATADTGIIHQPGQFGNLPGGEGFIAPIEGSAEGELSVGPPEDPAQWWFRFHQGEMVEIGGDPPFTALLEQVFAQHPAARNLAELGVGTNERAKPSESILEAEKILGTIHLALGDSAGFGGKVSVPFHQDYVIYHPTLILSSSQGDHRLVQDGTLQVR